MFKRNNFYFFSLIFSGLLIFGLSSCGGSGNEKDGNSDVDTTKKEVVESVELAPGMTPWDFPTVGITANVGDYVLCPGFVMYTNSLASEDPTSETYIFYISKMSATGDVESEIEFTFDGKQKMPNSMLIPIPAEQTVAKGDIVLTWWQGGSGMQRAIITDDSNPAEPKAVFLDLSLDMQIDDDTKEVGTVLEANSFVKITDSWQAGNLIAAKDGSSYNSVQIIRVEGDKVLTIGFAGRIKVYAKADCKPVPIVPNVKKGDKVMATFVGGFGEYEVSKVDTENGLVYVIQFDKEEPIPYGQIATEL